MQRRDFIVLLRETLFTELLICIKKTTGAKNQD